MWIQYFISLIYWQTLIGIGPDTEWGDQSLVYFNAYGREKYLGWQYWCNFECIPHENISVYNSSVLPFDGKLLSKKKKMFQSQSPWKFQNWTQNPFFF